MASVCIVNADNTRITGTVVAVTPSGYIVDASMVGRVYIYLGKNKSKMEAPGANVSISVARSGTYNWNGYTIPQYVFNYGNLTSVR